uniref:Bm13498 n=1 Tax=Brugia malayi TaxID=6279 RepID=A0A0J9XXY0_BRUMA|nr:Bm13498 [Brugia malayi]
MLIGMRSYMIIAIVLLLMQLIRSNQINSRHHLSLFIEQQWYNNISLIYRLNDCKYSKVKLQIFNQNFIIVSRTYGCNEVIKMIFGTNVKAIQNRSDIIEWVIPYSYMKMTSWRNGCYDNAYFDNAIRTDNGSVRVDIRCDKRRLRVWPRIWKRFVQKNMQMHHPFAVNIYESNERLFTITIGALLYFIFGICFLVTNLAYLSGIYTVHSASIIPEKNEKKKQRNKREKE